MDAREQLFSGLLAHCRNPSATGFLKNIFNYLYFYVYWCVCLHVCLYTACMAGAHGGQKVLDAEMVVSHHVNAGNHMLVL